MFSTLLRTSITILITFILLSANSFNLNQSNILSFGKGLNKLYLRYDTRRQKIFGLPKLKAFEDHKSNVTQILKLYFIG